MEATTYTADSLYDALAVQGCQPNQFLGRDDQDRRICLDCPAGLTGRRLPGLLDQCQKACPPRTYLSEDGLECLSDAANCSIWESADANGRCAACEQKATAAQEALEQARVLAAATPVKVILKDAKQSSTWPSMHRGWMLEAKNAIDDDAASFSHTRMGRGHWWTASFEGGPRVVKEVIITNRGDCCGERLRDTRVYIGKTLCGKLPAYTEKGAVYTVTCASSKGVSGDQITIRQNTYTTALQLATVEVRGLDRCLIEESATHQCRSSAECRGARECSRWGWCQNPPNFDPAALPECPVIAAPVVVKPYNSKKIRTDGKCMLAGPDFAEKVIENEEQLTLEQCTELAFANGGEYFQHRAY